MAELGVVRLPCLRMTHLGMLESALVHSILSALSAPSIRSVLAIYAEPVDLHSILPSNSHLLEIIPFLPRTRHPWIREELDQDMRCWVLHSCCCRLPQHLDYGAGSLTLCGRTAARQVVQAVISSIGRDLPFVNLEALSVVSVDAEMLAAYTAMLGNLCTITFLELQACSIDAVQALVVTDISHLCPLLQELTLDRVDVDDTCLIASAKSRVLGGDYPMHLRRIIVKGCKQITAFGVNELADLFIGVGSVDCSVDGGGHSAH
ncbi:hypothetical protein BOTBODRAFT_48294 [Botryobasidium botryosum FD-172 SS1]|uniref:F-box domain-containing protein n=1 Tax=Botryobasidium botryosum (strain FD-172 SS1) TaxID=930990 RepID=A0A067M8N4_BOTB1|nr:hypothetical protein BOTBODRAFT_48294 [Botryobasidium botryosum FD-172 SS1]